MDENQIQPQITYPLILSKIDDRLDLKWMRYSNNEFSFGI